MSQKDDIEELLTKHHRRLQELKKQKATFGLHAPPHISMEIEDIETEIETLEAQRAVQQSVAAERKPGQYKKSAAKPMSDRFDIEPPYGTMRPNSPFYIERAADADCLSLLSQPIATTIFEQAPRQMGKSSLMHRIIHLAKTKQAKKTVTAKAAYKLVRPISQTERLPLPSELLNRPGSRPDESESDGSSLPGSRLSSVAVAP